MGALIQLVAAAAVSPSIALQHEPRVFTDSFRERLAVLTKAERELRSMGLHVVWSRLAGPKPQAHILRDAKVSIKPLMDRMGKFFFHEDGDGKVISGEFEGVIVSWVEPK